MKKLFSLSICLIMLFSLFSCQKELTPIEKLTEDEKILYDALLVMSNSFFNPSEMRILEAGDSGIVSGDDCAHNTLTVRIQGENKVGGVSNDYYVVYLYSLQGKRLATVLAEKQVDSEEYWLETWNECSEDEYPRVFYSTFEEFKDTIVESRLRTNFFNTQEELNTCISDKAKEEWENCPSLAEFPRSSFSTLQEYTEFLHEYYTDEYFVVKDYDTELEDTRDILFGYYEPLEDSYIFISESEKYDVSKINKALKYYWDEKLGNLPE